MEQYDAISPLDYRYYGGNERIYQKVHPYLSEKAHIKYCLKVEVALVRGLERRSICSSDIAQEVEIAAELVTPEDVYCEDRVVHHYTKAIVNSLKARVSKPAKPFIHLSATSADIMDTSMALMLKDFVREVTVPDLLELERLLIKAARAGANEVQIGRTHGQHAVPITFGFAISEYVDRLGMRIEKIRHEAQNLRGQFSGAVGAYNALSLILPDPESFEEEVLADLDLRPSHHSTQVVQPEFVTDLVYAIISCFGVLANFADDMRHLQRTEIGEVREAFSEKQVGSSTMPHKRNPWNLEHVKSLWKEFTPRIITVLSDQISEHQRDLSNSASGRFVPEIFVGFTDAVDRLISICKGLEMDSDNMARTFEMSKDNIIAEPLYILLSLAGLEDAHEHVRRLTLDAEREGKSLRECALRDRVLQEYLKRMPQRYLSILEDPRLYTGVAARKTLETCDFWEAALLLE